MNLAGAIARRLRIGGSGSRESTGIAVGVAGVALAVTVMLLSLAVISGFKNEITRRVNGFEARVAIEPMRAGERSWVDMAIDTTASVLRLDAKMEAAIREVAPQARINQVVALPAMLKTDDDFAAVMLKGYDRPQEAQPAAESLVEGQIPAADNEILISGIQASALRLSVGDRVFLCFFDAEKGVKMRRATVSGIYDSRFTDYDRLYAYAPLALTAKVAALPDGSVNRIEINDITTEQELELAQTLQRRLLFVDGVSADVTPAQRAGAFYFNWLALLDTNVVVILILMSLVAAVTLISSLFILVLERVNMIGILKALGAGTALVRRVFVLLTVRILLRGLVIGNVVALGLIFLQSATHLIPLDADTYYLDYVPVEIAWWQVVALDGGAIVIAALVLVLPAQVVARLRPSASIRFD